MDPIDYTRRYSNSLIESNDLPEYVKALKNPEGIMLACDYEQKYELHGDLEAFAELANNNMLDLEDLDLGHYKSYLKSFLNPTRSFLYE